MTDNLDGRMLLSHNFALSDHNVHPLSREEFSAVFSQGLAIQVGIDCQLIDNPHWIVEVRYETSRYSPAEVGQLCADTLAQYRIANQNEGFYVMTLGGLKTTPPTGGPLALQTGEWGVDVVETRSPQEFLEEISWERLTAAKSAESIFKIEHPVQLI
jgi:hypothetical protein